MRIASRMAKIDSSGIRKVFNLAAKLEDPINLSIGQPHFDVPESVKDAAIAAIRAGKNGYTLTQGIPALRDGIRGMLDETRSWSPDEVMVSSGVSGAIMLALLVLIEPGDEVIIPDPYFVMYKHLVNLCGGVPVFIDTYPDFTITPQALESAVTPKTKLAILNTPSNPTGAVCSREELGRIAEVLSKHEVLAMSDEVYDAFSYDGEFTSMVEAYGENTLLLGGFSKSCAMTGWRLGYAAGPADVVGEMIKLQQFSFVNAASMVQEAGLVALEYDTSEFKAEYKRKRGIVYDGLKEHFEVTKPGGAFYIFPKAPWGTGEEFVAAAIKRGVLIIPGSVFSEQHTHFRLSYAAEDETLHSGVEVLVDLAKSGA